MSDTTNGTPNETTNDTTNGIPSVAPIDAAEEITDIKSEAFTEAITGETSEETSDEAQQANLKNYRKFFSGFGFRFFLGSLVIIGIQYAVSFLVAAVNPRLMSDPNWQIILGTVPMYLIGFPILYLLLKPLKKSVPTKEKVTALQFVGFFVCAYAIIYISNFVGVGIGSILEIFSDNVNATVSPTILVASRTNPVIQLIFMVILAPTIEELVFRKTIVDCVYEYGEAAAVLVSGLLFGLFHQNLTQFVYAFSLGCFLAFIYARYGKIQITIGIHLIINFIGVFVSLKLLQLIDYDRLVSLMRGPSANVNELMVFVSENMRGILLLGLYAIALIVVVISGIVVLLVKAPSTKFRPGTMEIPKGKRFSTVICNPGMLVTILFFLAIIVYVMFASSAMAG